MIVNNSLHIASDIDILVIFNNNNNDVGRTVDPMSLSSNVYRSTGVCDYKSLGAIYDL
jgi:hypothetical protein